MSPELEALIVSLMAKRPEDRPGSGAMVAQALSAGNRADSPARASGRGYDHDGGDSGGERRRQRLAHEIRVDRTVVRGECSAAANGATTEKASARSAAGPSRASPSRYRGDAIGVGAGGGLRPSAVLADRIVASTGGVTALIRSPLARRMLEVVLAEPILLSAEERYLHGHYLAYLLSGSRRRGLFLRRPLEPRNADRGRLLLGLTYAILAGGGEDAVREAASAPGPANRSSLDLVADRCGQVPDLPREPGQAQALSPDAQGPRLRPALTPKSACSTPRACSTPGLMPQKLEDLNLLAPPRDDVDDVLVERWNRVTEVWRNEIEFRTAVLRYATSNAHRDPASAALWPEVVYPLIERARWHRRIRPRTEAVWDYVCGRLHLPDAGVALDRALTPLRAGPAGTPSSTTS